jgi:hypothetical protein
VARRSVRRPHGFRRAPSRRRLAAGAAPVDRDSSSPHDKRDLRRPGLRPEEAHGRSQVVSANISPTDFE